MGNKQRQEPYQRNWHVGMKPTKQNNTISKISVNINNTFSGPTNVVLRMFSKSYGIFSDILSQIKSNQFYSWSPKSQSPCLGRLYYLHKTLDSSEEKLSISRCQGESCGQQCLYAVYSDVKAGQCTREHIITHSHSSALSHTLDILACRSRHSTGETSIFNSGSILWSVP